MTRSKVAALVLAAGLSSRLADESGAPKVLLDWGGVSMVQHIIRQLRAAVVEPLIVVTGREAETVQAQAEAAGARAVHNPDYARGEMLSSIKVGINALPTDCDALLIALGDQPRITTDIIARVIGAYQTSSALIAAPSFNMRRGHPILIDRALWAEIVSLPADGALRTVINAHADQTVYVVVEDDSVLRDVDTRADYAAERQRAGLPSADPDPTA